MGVVAAGADASGVVASGVVASGVVTSGVVALGVVASGVIKGVVTGVLFSGSPELHPARAESAMQSTRATEISLVNEYLRIIFPFLFEECIFELNTVFYYITFQPKVNLWIILSSFGTNGNYNISTLLQVTVRDANAVIRRSRAFFIKNFISLFSVRGGRRRRERSLSFTSPLSLSLSLSFSLPLSLSL